VQPCKRFSNLNLRIPVLSVYETLETKAREAGYWRKTGKIVLPRTRHPLTCTWAHEATYDSLRTVLAWLTDARYHSGKLIGRCHAMVNMGKEELFGMSAPHTELHFVTPGSDLFNRLVVFFQSAPQDGLVAINAAYERLKIDIDFSDNLSSATRPADFEQDNQGPY